MTSESRSEFVPETVKSKPKSAPRRKKAAPVSQDRQAVDKAVVVESESEASGQPAIPVPIEIDANIKNIVEAILFAANRAMTTRQIQQVFPESEQPELKDIQAAVDAIMLDYGSRPVGLKKLASGYRFQVKEGMSPWISRLFEEKPPRYSRALLETLSIIAYRQPVTRGEIEDIRGVSVSSHIVRTLLDREWIRIVAHKEVPGRPALYGTTKLFLDYFNLAALDELPTLEEIKDFEAENEISAPSETTDSETQKASAGAESPNPKNRAGETAVSGNEDIAPPENSTLH